MRKIVTVILSVICAALMIGALAACGDDGLTDYKISVYSVGGDKLRNVTVSLYNDDLERIAYDTTDNDGSVNFRLDAGEYDVRLTSLPAGYIAPTKSYSTDLEGSDVEIYLESKVIEGSAPTGYKYSVGDVMYDFEVLTTDGEIFKLSEALESKKLVMINLWATWCSPCVSEFPHMSEAYEEYKDDVAIIALSSYDNNDAIRQFLTVTHPECNSSFGWASDIAGVSSHFDYTGIPTNIFVDRYGVYSFSYTGGMTKSEFTRYFSKYCSDDYVQNFNRGDGEDEDVFERPKPIYDSLPSETIEAAINGEGFSGTYHPEQDTNDKEYSWPWLVGTDEDGKSYIYNSNKGVQQYSFATIYLNFHAQPGDVLAFDYYADIEDGYDYLYVFYDDNEVSSLTGYTETWQTYFLYVVKEEGDFQVCFFYYADEMNDENSEVEDIIKIRNIRLTTVQAITDAGQGREIKYHCATGFNEAEQKWNNYVEVGYNEEDGYYHLMTGEGNDKQPNGPLVLLNTMVGSHWSNDSLYELASLNLFDFGAKGNYNNIILDYAGYSALSDYQYYVPVTKELQEALVAIAANYIPKEFATEGHETYPEEWLEMCVYYVYYGVGESVKDPIKGITYFSSFDLQEYTRDESYTDENYEDGIKNNDLVEVNINKLIVPRGMYYKFVPATTAVYEFTTYGSYGTICWIYEAEDLLNGRDNAIVLNELSSDDANFKVYVPMTQGTEYYILLDMESQDDIGKGSFYLGARSVGDSVQKFIRVTEDLWTTSSEDDFMSSSAVIIMIADAFMTDPVTEQPYLQDRGCENIPIYADFYGLNPFLSVSLKEVILRELADEGSYYWIYEYDKNGNNVYDDNGELKTLALKFDDAGWLAEHGFAEGTLQKIQEWLRIAENNTGELHGMVQVDKDLMDFLDRFAQIANNLRSAVAGENEDAHYVENDWLMFCYFYRTYTVNTTETN